MFVGMLAYLDAMSDFLSNTFDAMADFLSNVFDRMAYFL
jgi:hypothetical protein